MILTRRTFLAAAAAGLAMPQRLWSAMRLESGTFRLDTLSDGHLVLPSSFLFGGLPEEELRPILARHAISGPSQQVPCNVTLLRDGTHTVLFDVGSGPDFMPTAGRLSEALSALEVAPEDVTHVVFTHGHPDHLWGLLDEFDEPVFSGAQHMMGRAEFDYWTDPDTASTIGEARQSFAAGAKRRLEAMADRIALFEDGAAVLPGVTARLTAGHTPGHMAFVIDAPDPVMLAGDAIGNAHVGFERPDWPVPSDQDPELGARTRAGLLDQITADRMVLIGFHLPEGGIGRTERHAGGYRFLTA
ncbi:MBL fold metallo-hydrolase [Rhodobacter sp. CZR27]|uniref:MBL fold metallo-hydrolase n=1 Tax=Rhodobacter sp. CZR27 TaxID=2033869 RepID=UPI000BBF0242|nr:MBL fold metallo-hydrolase [Rhodobacter sp. CZR27]